MTKHKNILVAIDLSEEAQVVLRRAMELAEFYSAGLHVIHVMLPFQNLNRMVMNSLATDLL